MAEKSKKPPEIINYGHFKIFGFELFKIPFHRIKTLRISHSDTFSHYYLITPKMNEKLNRNSLGLIENLKF